MRNDDQAYKQNVGGTVGSIPPDKELDALERELRWAEESQKLAVGILRLLSRQISASDAIRKILSLVKESTGFEAVGIRLREGEDFPYFETKGFPGNFVESENYLCSRTESGEIIRDFTGNPVLECMCGNIIRGRTDPSLPFFTPGGSFWSNCTTDLLATTTDEDRQTRTRNRCNGEGYESVALIPLRSESETIGLLQLNDSRKNCFTPEMIRFFEEVGVSIGIVVEGKKAEEALRESEARVRMKLDSILLPEGDIAALELADVIDTQAIQALMDDFYKLTGIPVGIIDLAGKVLVATGWQEICTKFHRTHPETCGYCIESDTLLSRGVEPGSFKLHRCKNNMWDMATPIIVGGKHLGNVFLGQFLYEDEAPDSELFRSQARRYGFDEKLYLAALEKVPRWSRDTVDAAMTFFTKLADILSTLGYGNIKLARSISEQERLVNSLQESEKRYRSLFENMLEGFAYCRMLYEDGKPQDFVFLSVNDSFERLTGLKNVVGKKVTEVIPGIKESDPEIFDIYGRVASTGNPERLEAYVDSLGIWFSISVYSSEREHFVTVFDNITERKRAEEQVKQAKEFLNTVVDNLPVPLFAKSAQNGQFVLWNKASETLFGYPRDQVIGKTDYDYFPKEQADFFWEKDRETFASGEVIDIPEEPILTKSFGTRILHTRKVPVYDKNKQPSYLLGISQDITERKEAEDSLRHLSAFQQTMIDAMPNPIFYKDVSGKYLGCNEAFASLLGLSKEAVVGKSVYEIVPREVADTWNEKDQEVFDRPHVQSYDFRFVAADILRGSLSITKRPFLLSTAAWPAW